MAIVVNCRCGKKFKVKDQLAGRKARCPACKGPLRIPGEKVASPASAAEPPPAEAAGLSEATAAAEQALLRFEAEQKNKSRSAEEEAAYLEERNRLIASYDQLAGKKTTGKKKKGEPAPGKPRKVTIFTKLADAWGAIRGTLVFRYVFIVLVLSAGTLGSIYLVKFIYTYTNREIGPSKSFEEKRDALFAKAEAAVAAKRWGEARDTLEELRRLGPRMGENRRFLDIQKRIEEGFDRQ